MQVKPSSDVTITEAALGAFEAGDQRALHLALNLSPWTPSPLNVDGPYPPVWVAPRGHWAQDWWNAWQLRQALQEAA